MNDRACENLPTSGLISNSMTWHSCKYCLFSAPLPPASAAAYSANRNVAIVQGGAVLGQNRAVHLVERGGERQPGGAAAARIGRRASQLEKGRVCACPRKRVIDGRHVHAERACE
ncbi:hypothetical protein AYI69_g6132 [Smittium culicis]|uniref:Uncharacterized protein n=1 Tax=Smittium culicis TaxID=133412 RepID=A0A1R1Y1F2_9FUNG|nr:hypothetical protein AYI69_g6132 [Smittium culicis]